MATPWHHDDFKTVPDQDRVMDALRSFNLGPGDYVVPRPASRKAEASPEFAAYIAGAALPAGAESKQVFQCAGATAFTGFALGLRQQTIWYSRSWVTTLKSTIDGLVYGVVIVGVFAWLGPR
jgi:hypothetical protein